MSTQKGSNTQQIKLNLANSLEFNSNCIKLLPKQPNKTTQKLVIGDSEGCVSLHSYQKKYWNTNTWDHDNEDERKRKQDVSIKSVDICNFKKDKSDRIFYTNGNKSHCLSKSNMLKMSLLNLYDRQEGYIKKAYTQDNYVIALTNKHQLLNIAFKQISSWALQDRHQYNLQASTQIHKQINDFIWNSTLEQAIAITKNKALLLNSCFDFLGELSINQNFDCIKLFDISKDSFQGCRAIKDNITQTKKYNQYKSSVIHQTFGFMASTEGNNIILGTFFDDHSSKIEQILTLQEKSNCFGCGDILRNGKKILISSFNGGYEFFKENENNEFERLYKEETLACSVINNIEHGDFLLNTNQLSEFIISTSNGQILSVQPNFSKQNTQQNMNLHKYIQNNNDHIQLESDLYKKQDNIERNQPKFQNKQQIQQICNQSKTYLINNNKQLKSPRQSIQKLNEDNIKEYQDITQQNNYYQIEDINYDDTSNNSHKINSIIQHELQLNEEVEESKRQNDKEFIQVEKIDHNQFYEDEMFELKSKYQKAITKVYQHPRKSPSRNNGIKEYNLKNQENQINYFQKNERNAISFTQSKYISEQINNQRDFQKQENPFTQGINYNQDSMINSEKRLVNHNYEKEKEINKNLIIDSSSSDNDIKDQQDSKKKEYIINSQINQGNFDFGNKLQSQKIYETYRQNEDQLDLKNDSNQNKKPNHMLQQYYFQNQKQTNQDKQIPVIERNNNLNRQPHHHLMRKYNQPSISDKKNNNHIQLFNISINQINDLPLRKNQLNTIKPQQQNSITQIQKNTYRYQFRKQQFNRKEQENNFLDLIYNDLSGNQSTESSDKIKEHQNIRLDDCFIENTKDCSQNLINLLSPPQKSSQLFSSRKTSRIKSQRIKQLFNHPLQTQEDQKGYDQNNYQLQASTLEQQNNNQLEQKDTINLLVDDEKMHSSIIIQQEINYNQNKILFKIETNQLIDRIELNYNKSYQIIFSENVCNQRQHINNINNQTKSIIFNETLESFYDSEGESYNTNGNMSKYNHLTNNCTFIINNLNKQKDIQFEVEITDSYQNMDIQTQLFLNNYNQPEQRIINIKPFTFLKLQSIEIEEFLQNDKLQNFHSLLIKNITFKQVTEKLNILFNEVSKEQQNNQTIQMKYHSQLLNMSIYLVYTNHQCFFYSSSINYLSKLKSYFLENNPILSFSYKGFANYFDNLKEIINQKLKSEDSSELKCYPQGSRKLIFSKIQKRKQLVNQSINSLDFNLQRQIKNELFSSLIIILQVRNNILYDSLDPIQQTQLEQDIKQLNINNIYSFLFNSTLSDSNHTSL